MVYLTLGEDPYIVLNSFWLKFFRGWVSFRFKVASSKTLSAKLYLDYGEGFSEADTLKLTQTSLTTYQAEFALNSKLKALRLDPTEEEGVELDIKKLQLVMHSELLYVLKQFIVIMRHDFKSNIYPFRVIEKSYARYKKHGRVGMLERLDKEYRVIRPKAILRNNQQSLDYQLWIQQNELPHHRAYALAYTPLISVVIPVYNTPVEYLQKCIDSVLEQSYKNFELCIADDASTDKETITLLKSYESHEKIKIVYREENGHISSTTNSALVLAEGEYVAFLDHDDMLAKNALFEVAKVINENQDLKLIYSDEDKIDANERRFEPHFKSGWNPDMFYSHNYISHLSVIKRELVEKAGGLRAGYEGAQDYDLLLHVLEGVKTHEIAHIEKILYHWRAIVGSTALGADEKEYTTLAGLKALQDYFDKKESGIVVLQGLLPNTYKVVYPVPGIAMQEQLKPHIQDSLINQSIYDHYLLAKNNSTSNIQHSTPIEKAPLVSILIPTRDGYDILSKCVQSILEYTTYKNYEIIIIDNETTDKQTLEYFEELKQHQQISIVEYHHSFNYSAINNFGVKHAKGEVIALLNNDVEVISDHWLTEMVQHALRPDIGAVGAMLYYDNDTIQHAGIVLGIGGVAGHSHKYVKRDAHGYFSRLKIMQNYSAVTAACLVVRRGLFLEVEGLDETDLKIAFNDVDFCLKIQKQGFRNLWTPYVELYHHESVSRGTEDDEVKKARFEREVLFMQGKWNGSLKEDVYYNPNLTKKREDYGLNINE